jgi:membrane protease YdiL (CAAX protease family)
MLALLTERFGFRVTAFMTGGIWALWRFPPLLLPGFIAKPKPAMEMTFFTGMVIGLSFVIGWVRMKTQSIWPCVLRCT